jgi:hypothetical protein
MPRFSGGGRSGAGLFAGLLGFGLGASLANNYPQYSGPGFVPTGITPGYGGLVVTDPLYNPYLYPYGQSYPGWLLGSPAYANFYAGRGGRRMWNRWLA